MKIKVRLAVGVHETKHGVDTYISVITDNGRISKSTRLFCMA
jgi:coenzyme F420-reducing hydrogenase alpha subunit